MYQKQVMRSKVWCKYEPYGLMSLYSTSSKSTKVMGVEMEVSRWSVTGMKWYGMNYSDATAIWNKLERWK